MKRALISLLIALVTSSAAQASFVTATGGVVTNINGYCIHTFTNSGELSVSAGGEVEVLVVGGGGSGGNNGGGGGGAGGLIHSNAFPVVASNYTVTVGPGAGLILWNSSWTTTNGMDSVFGSLIAKGGGGGSSRDYGPQAASGGSGGGGGGSDSLPRYLAGSGTSGQGYDGKNGAGSGGADNTGGGGGGAGGLGTAGVFQIAGNGGPGLEFTNFAAVAGSPAGWFAGGGGGGRVVNGTNGTGGTGGGGDAATIGAPNTGGGGGGGGNGVGGPKAGGSGIVIIRYPLRLDLPNVNNASGATNVTTTNAWLNGDLSSTGTSATAALVYWGETDGGTNATQWANTNTLAAPQSIGPLTVSVTLDAGKEYFYRYAATNDSGQVWANTSEYLLTAGITVSANPTAISENRETASFSFSRAAAVTSSAVTVTYEIGGSAVNGVNYQSLPLTNITISAGDTNATVQVTSIFDVASSADKTLGLTVLGGRNYAVGTPSNAVLSLTNVTFVVSAINGAWDAGATWVGGSIPGSNDDVIITNGCTVTIRTNTTISIQSLTIQTNGVLTHTANTTTALGERYKVVLDVTRDMAVDLGGKINVDGMGYIKVQGLGKSPDGQYGAGASYGGVGGPYGTSRPGPTYGSVMAPTNLGSGGAYPGGGAVRLTVAGTTTIDGLISASGDPTSVYCGGSGGSVFLTTGGLAGSGTIRANGGPAGSYNGASGAGGRVAVLVTDSWGGTVKLQAWTSYGRNGYSGSPGTIYVETPDQEPGKGTLTVNANNVVPKSPSVTLINSLVTDATVGTVIITNKAVLAVSNQVLTVQGDLDNKGTVLGWFNGTVVFGGTNAATLTGHNVFYNLICTNTEKTLYFQEGKTNTVNGTLTLKGATLDSISGSAQWYLKASTFTHSVSNVTAGRSDASPGVSIQAFDSTNLGSNVNWVFAESGFATNTWTGMDDSNWGNDNNWSKGRATIDSDTVVIPATSHDPLLNAHKVMQSLVISNGASMSLAGFNLTVVENTPVAGTLTATGAETLTFGGDLDFSGGGSFGPATSTVLLSGTNAQSVVSAGNAFYQLTIDKSDASVMFADAVIATRILNQDTLVTFDGDVTVASAFWTQGTNVTFGGAVTAPAFYNETGALVFSGTVSTVTFTNWQADLTFRDDFSSQEFYCAPGGMDLTFEASTTVTIGDFELYGHSGEPIQLRSSAAAYWNLDVTNWAKVRHVDVQYSDASAGQTIRPVASTDSGNNPNWVFSGPWQTWDGSVSSVFTNENNWTPAGVLDSSTRLLIDGYYTTAPILSGTVTVAQVIVGGYMPVTLTVNGTLTTLENVEILSMGTVTHSVNTTSEANKLGIMASDLTVAPGGQINVEGKGYGVNKGPGRSPDGSTGAGASYGGMGAPYTVGNIPGPTYGSVTAPTNCGSGGSYPGGGSVRLSVTGTASVDGLISASGDPRSAQCGGSGGTVFLTTGALAGDGTIRANGGPAASYNGGSGGGGRVAVRVTNTWGGTVQMQAWSSYGRNGFSGTPGTIYVETPSQSPGHGTLTVNANNVVPKEPATTLINNKVTDAVVGTVILKSQAILTVDTNQTLTVNGSWSNAATFVAGNDSTVDFASTNAATVTANNAFYNLTAGAAGKTIRFEAGKTNTVNGKLTFVDDTTLLSTADGTQWWLDLADPAGTQEVGRVTVKDSNADPGQEILAKSGSTALGNNVNWSFPVDGTLFRFR